MKTSRIKLPLNTNIITSRDDAEVVMRELAHAVNSQRRIHADRDAAILQINKRVEKPLADLDDKISGLTDALRAWAESNPEQFPKGRKSLDLVSGTIGFRTGTPALKLFSRAFTWDKVLTLIQARFDSLYIRVKKEVAKDKIIEAHASRTISSDDLRSIGLKVDQAESFFAEPQLSDLPTRQTMEAA